MLPECTKYAWLQKLGGVRTVLMTPFVSCALYAVPHVRVKSEVYFGLKNNQWQNVEYTNTNKCNLQHLLKKIHLILQKQWYKKYF